MDGAFYSNQQIKKGLQSGQIVCHPLIEANIRGASLDITLGQSYYRTKVATDYPFYNPFSKEDVLDYFVGPLQAIEHGRWAEKAKVQPLKNIPLNHPVIALKPGERILAHTNEFVGIRPPGACNMLARSTWGRNGLAVCFDAGWGDPGYINRWTMEIYNLNQYHSLVLPIGERIAQIIFYHTGEVEGDYARSGKYQTSDDLAKIMANWHPSQMLPKAYLDKRQQKFLTENYEN